MKILLVADGKVLTKPFYKELTRFFNCSPAEMTQVSASAFRRADVAIVDLTDASPQSLQHLKSATALAKRSKIICPVTKGDRWEHVQGGALGRALHFDRSLGFKALVFQIREMGEEADCDHQVLEKSSEQVQAAFKKANSLLNDLPFAIGSSGEFPTKLLRQAAEALTDVMQGEGVGAWMGAVQSHHSHTFRHSLYVAGLATSFSQVLGWKKEQQNMIAAGGLLHDIGKTRIPLSILDKPGKLTAAEFDLIKKHPVFGQEILRTKMEVPIDVRKMAFHHHEYLDGSGYPHGLNADDIGPMVRVMTISDIFAALTEERSYKDPMSPRVAYAELVNMGGKLDQSLVRKFREVVIHLDIAKVKRTEATGFAQLARAKTA